MPRRSDTFDRKLAAYRKAHAMTDPPASVARSSGQTAASDARIETGRMHALRTGHSTQESIFAPWTCDDCPARSTAYLLVEQQAAATQGERDV